MEGFPSCKQQKVEGGTLGNLDWKDWSDGWIKEGYYISFLKDGVLYYERVSLRDLGHWEYDWFESINPSSESGPRVPELLEITKGYDEKTNSNQIWQLIFGIQSQAYIYIELPTDLHRHGIPKLTKPGTVTYRVSHFEEWMSPFDEPSFITEHFMMRPDLDRLNLSAYNRNPQPLTDVVLNFFINKMITERVGTVQNGVKTATSSRWEEVLDKLYRGLIPVRPISLYPVRAPAEAHG